MSNKLRIVSAVTLEKLLFLLGFKAVRRKGSHVFYRHEDGRYTTIPHHPGRDLSRSLIRTILRQIGLSIEEYIELLDKL